VIGLVSIEPLTRKDKSTRRNMMMADVHCCAGGKVGHAHLERILRAQPRKPYPTHQINHHHTLQQQLESGSLSLSLSCGCVLDVIRTL